MVYTEVQREWKFDMQTGREFRMGGWPSRTSSDVLCSSGNSGRVWSGTHALIQKRECSPTRTQTRTHTCIVIPIMSTEKDLYVYVNMCVCACLQNSPPQTGTPLFSGIAISVLMALCSRISFQVLFATAKKKSYYFLLVL